MPHLGLQRVMVPGSQVSSLTTGNITLAGAKSAFDVGPYGAYEPLAVVEVGSGGASSISFTGISAKYKNLQIRVFAQTSRGTYGNDQMTMRFNGDMVERYSVNILTGDGSSASGGTSTSGSNFDLSYKLGTTTSGAFGIYIIDIFDYSSPSKYKTMRCLSGVDVNGTIAGYGGEVALHSGIWQSYSSVTSITLTPSNANFTQYSHFAIYGVK